MLKVKISSRGSGRAASLAQFVGNDRNEWMGCQFHVNADCTDPDIWIVSEDLEDWDCEAEVPENSIIFTSAETSWEPGFYDNNPVRTRFLDQFSWIYTCHDILRRNVTAALPFLPWMVNANHGASINAIHERDLFFLQNLSDVPKEKSLSVICSSQTRTDGHRLRLRLVEKLKEYFGDQLDWYGNGVNPIDEKWIGLAPYRYSIAIENLISWNVATEKLWDPLLTYTLPIYGGAPNASHFLPKGSFVPINIKDLNGTIETIEELLESDAYQEALPAISKARKSVLGPLNAYSRMAEIAHRHARNGTRRLVVLEPRSSMEKRHTRSTGRFSRFVRGSRS